MTNVQRVGVAAAFANAVLNLAGPFAITLAPRWPALVLAAAAIATLPAFLALALALYRTAPLAAAATAFFALLSAAFTGLAAYCMDRLSHVTGEGSAYLVIFIGIAMAIASAAIGAAMIAGGLTRVGRAAGALMPGGVIAFSFGVAVGLGVPAEPRAILVVAIVLPFVWICVGVALLRQSNGGPGLTA